MISLQKCENISATMDDVLQFKGILISLLIAELEERLRQTLQSAIEAREWATNEESKAENKYDTRGLEASYLAGAQSKRVEELEIQVRKLKKIELVPLMIQKGVQPQSLVTLAPEEGPKKTYFIFPVGGGTRLLHQGQEIIVLSPQSPLGQKLIGKHVGDALEWGKKGDEQELVIEEIE